MTMDAKDLRIESALGAHNDDGNTKYAQSGTTFQPNGNKPYDIGSNSMAKVDVPTARPCAIIGPDRVVPPQSTNDAYVKKVPVEPWQCTESIYQHPPEYPHKLTDYQLSRNISPRQTFQENMQRIMVPPSFASVKNSEDHCLNNPKLMSLESKFCDVPYAINPINNEPKIVKNSDGLVLNNNYNQPSVPHGWAGSGVNVRPLRPYGAPDLYQYSEYANCPGPRPISMIRPHRNIHEEMPQVYQDRFHEANIRFKPYPATKERPLQNPHSRYDYIPNYPNAFQPPTSYPPHKYELQKSIPPHPYPIYPPIPLKYLERRMPVSTMEKYPRSPNQQVNLNQPYCNQNMPSTYGPLPGNCLQNRAFPYSPDPASKNMIQNRLYFDNHNTRKYYTSSENMFTNDINRPPTIKTDLMYPSYPPMNIHSLPPHHMYRKDSSMKAYDHAIHYRNIEYTNINPLGRVPLQFSPQTMSISPTDSNASNDTTQIMGSAQDDCGYASQSSTASIRSVESGVNRMSNDIYRRQDMTLPHVNKFGQKVDSTTGSKDKKGLDVRQFLQMWNEGDDEGNDNSKEPIKQRDSNNSLRCYESGKNHEQLYVLDLVNVPKEELAKYDHIQKISKLPENIKGYNSIELLNQYEKLVESPGLNQFSLTPTQPKQKDLHVPIRNSFPRQGMEVSSASTRPLSPLDVEAKISQSVIHKEVGCNFEIRPCSPQMMNVELATPVHNVLGERLIEKVVNPVKTKSPICQRIEETNNIVPSRSSPKITSCKMVSNQYPSPHLNESLKTNYCLQDLESSSGVCLASLPRLDNDIELNFPEINQQFINDNKMSSVRDLPMLDTDNSGNSHNNKSKINNQPFIIEHPTSGSDSDKDVSKLSKYRKQKRYSVPNDKDITLNMSLHRTDSVIIKNPDNVKSHEEYSTNVPNNNNNTPITENIINPVNIIRENDKAVNYSDKNSSEILNESRDSDTAIDFSLSKCDNIVQSNGINNLSNLNNSLKNNNEIDNETIHEGTDKFCMDLPKQIEITLTDNISEVKSPTLYDITCSKVLDDSVILQSIDENSQVPHNHESVITHSKSQEIISDITLFREEIDSHNDLPSLGHDNENVPTNVTGSNEIVLELNSDIENQAVNCASGKQSNDIVVPVCEVQIGHDNENVPTNVTGSNEIVLELSSDIENQAVNCASGKQSNDIVVPVCEVENKLGTENLNGHDIVEDINVDEGDPWSEKKENNIVSQESIAKNISQTFSDKKANKPINDLVIQESETENIEIRLTDTEGEENMSNKILKVVIQEPVAENIEIRLTEPEGEGNMSNKILKVVNQIINTEIPNNQECNIIECKSYDNVDFTNKHCDENQTEKEPTNISSINSNVDCISQPDGDDLAPIIAINDFDSINITCTKMDIFENDDSLPITKTNKKITEDLTDELEISPLLLNGNVSKELLKSDANAYQVKYEFTFNKKLFSPIIQNLLLYDEGSCTSITTYGNEDNEEGYVKPVGDLNYSNEEFFEQLNIDPECKNNTSNHTIGVKDVESINTVTSDNSTEFVEYGVTTAGDTHGDPINTAAALPKLQHNDKIINNVKDMSQPESFVVENYTQVCSKSVLKVPDEETDDMILDYNIETTEKVNNYVEERNPLHLIWGQLPRKRKRTFKRSLSESAVSDYTAAADDVKDDNYHKCSRKRTKIDESNIFVESEVLNENFTSFIQSNRRNSVSTIYNDENVSFCILIDNDCVLTQDNESCPKICYTEIPDECLTTICTEEDTLNPELTENICYDSTADIHREEEGVDSEMTTDIYYENNVLLCDKADNIISEIDPEKNSYEEPELGPGENDLLLQNVEGRTIEETWVEDVACMETIFSDDIAEDIVISAPSSPKDTESSEDESDTNFGYNININEHTHMVKNIYGHQMCDDDAELVEKLYRTPQMNVNQTLINRESLLSQEFNRYYDNESLEKILSESNTLDMHIMVQDDSKPDKSLVLPSTDTNVDVHANKENFQDLSEKKSRQEIYSAVDLPDLTQTELAEERKLQKYDDCLVHSCESSCDNVAGFKKDEKLHYAISSSPEVSSTTSEEKGPAILLKIRSYKGSKISEVNEMSASFNHTHSRRPLITKAAQKYIPPLKEAIHDLKVKIRLPKQSLYKLQQLKKSKEKPKIDANRSKFYIKSLPHETIKKAKPKPKFEDVLMSIDEIQLKKHKTKNKKNKLSVPKVIIKKNENGAHYASTQTKETFNPDLTGRKWQPWVFLEKNNFVDKMALKQKCKAIYSHRKKTFVLAENFRKYKSISNAKFVISHPQPNDKMSTGNLKYTFRLKHS